MLKINQLSRSNNMSFKTIVKTALELNQLRVSCALNAMWDNREDEATANFWYKQMLDFQQRELRIMKRYGMATDCNVIYVDFLQRKRKAS